MDHDSPCILRVTGFHLLEELEHANWGERHPKVWPAGEMELSDEALWFPVGHITHLSNEEWSVCSGNEEGSRRAGTSDRGQEAVQLLPRLAYKRRRNSENLSGLDRAHELLW